MSSGEHYKVRAAHCDHRAPNEEIYNILCEIVEPLKGAMEKIAKARKIVIKANMAWPPDRIAYFEGRRREHVDDSILRAVLRLLRERSNARIIATDTDAYGLPGNEGINYIPILDEYGVEFINSNDPPFKVFEVPGGGMMFSRYMLSECFDGADAVVSIAKMKNHAFMGVTLCLKNLFGLVPMLPHYRPRQYFHHFVRLPYVLVDLGLIIRPCLNIIDALVGQSRREWGGQGHICNTIIAGDHVIATDACATWLMGHEPASDWPTPPFRRDQNALAIAAKNGFGTVDLNCIDFQTEVSRPLAAFDSDPVDSHEVVQSWRKTTCEQALFYRDHMEDFMDRYPGEYIFLQDGEVVLRGPDFWKIGSRRELSRKKPDHALWLKFVDPENFEEEHFNVYESILNDLLANKRMELYEEGRLS